MTDWEQKLRNIAEGPRWEVPAIDQVKTSLEQLRELMTRVASDTGFTGDTDTAASDDLQTRKSDVQALISYLESDLPTAIEAANARREEAQTRLDALGSGELSPSQKQTIRTAAAGATVVLGGFSVVAGEGAIAAANWFMGSQRDDEARAAYQDLEAGLSSDGDALPDPPEFDRSGDIDQGPEEPSGPDFQDPGAGDGPGGGRTPDSDVPAPTGLIDSIDIGDEIGTIITDPGTDTPVFVTPDTPIFVTPDTPVYITPTPDGPILSGTPGLSTLPGTGTIGGGIGGGGVGGGGLGGGLSSGLIAGAGGAAAPADWAVPAASGAPVGRVASAASAAAADSPEASPRTRAARRARTGCSDAVPRGPAARGRPGNPLPAVAEDRE
jgi:hypothetical protein